MNKEWTEGRNPDTMHIDRADTGTMLALIQKENYKSLQAVDRAMPQIEKAVDAAALAISKGARILYAGAGTSGRLAVVDASECPPTFGTDPCQVRALIAGGENAIVRAVEGAEDSDGDGMRDFMALAPSPDDFVLGLSASGNVPYVVGVLRAARQSGCTTAGLVCNSSCAMEAYSDILIVTETGPEVITGSTRMKAGNAQKLVLNMISTCAMVKTGKVYENLMINLRPTNRKLRDRMIRIVSEICRVEYERAQALLEEHGWSIRAVFEARGIL